MARSYFLRGPGTPDARGQFLAQLSGYHPMTRALPHPLGRVLRLVAYLYLARWLPEGPMPGGKISRRIRSRLVAPLLDYAAPTVYIERDARFGDGSKVRLGERSNLGIACRLHGPVHIGDDVMMSPDVHVYANSHGTAPGAPMWEQAYLAARPVTIGHNVWIGARVIILPGVTIGSHVRIGAGSVVTKDVPSESVVAGNPARVVRANEVTSVVRALYPRSASLQ